MYEELIAALNSADKRPCSDLECPGSGECPTVGCLFREAADAIAELNRLRVAAEENRMHWQDMAVKFECDLHDAEGKIPKWVSVNERLPEEYVDVLCYCSRNGQYGCGEWRKEDNGTIYWVGLNGMIPTHWMPLPKPPKED